MSDGKTPSPADRSQWKGRPISERLLHLEITFVFHPLLSVVLLEVKSRLKLLADGGRPLGIFIIAEPGGGKTRLLTHLETLYPQEVLSERTIQRYVWIAVPNPCRQVEVANAILKALGDPLWDGKRPKVQLARAIDQLKASKTVLLGIDNAQDIPERTGPVNVKLVGNFIRDVIDACRVVTLFVGTEDAGFVLAVNKQLKRRIPAELPLSDYPIDEEVGLATFLRLLHEIDLVLPLAEDSHLKDGQKGKALTFAADGKFSHVINILSIAIAHAVEEQRESLTLEDLSYAYQKYFLHTSVNPFTPGFKDWRRLNRPGEPHYLITDTRDRKTKGGRK